MIDEKSIKELKKILKVEVTNSGVLSVAYIEEQLKKNPSIYLYYPYLFSKIFNIENDQSLLKLSVGGFFHYLNILHSDYLVDIKDKREIKNIEEKITIIQALTEQSIKLFSEVFPNDSSFWDFWINRKKEFVNTRLHESKLTYDNFSKEKYHRIADNKVAFAKAAIDACYVMGGMNNKEKYNSLIDSHRLFSIGYQISDDINDIKKDIKDGQFNYAFFRCKEQKIFKNDENIDIESFYYSNLIKDLYLEAISYYKKALNALNESTVNSLWSDVINFKIFEATQKIETLDQYKKINGATELLSSKKLFKSKLTKIERKDLDQSINKGIDFVLSKFNESHWEEYITQAGISTYWATAFIGSLLVPISEYEAKIKDTLSKAKEYIKARKTTLWSFNDKWGVLDADSTNFSLLFLASKEMPIIEKWLSFQTKKGGFATYNKESNLERFFVNESFESFNGWYSSHLCVSAVSAHILYTVKDCYNKEWLQLINFLKDSQNKKGFWNSYWWGHPIYTTYYLYALFSKKTPDYADKLRKTDVWVKSILNEDGSISDSFGKSTFFSGFLLKLFMNNPDAYNRESNNTALFLMKNQFDDGSWENSHSLQIPSPVVLQPENAQYGEIKTYGVNIRSREFQRLFSTAVCLNSLYSYKVRKDLI